MAQRWRSISSVHFGCFNVRPTCAMAPVSAGSGEKVDARALPFALAVGVEGMI